MNNSQNTAKGSMSIWQFTLLISVAYVLGLLISHNTTELEPFYWSGYQLEEKTANGEWINSNRFRIGKQDGIQEVRFNLSIDDAEHWQRPIGLMFGGPFSAEVFWDDQLIAQKGRVGASKAEEEAGSIDAIAFVPPALLQPGEHQIRMRLSTQHLRIEDSSVFHHIWLTPYRENARRDMRYYAAPLIVLSALIVLSFQSLRIGRSAGNPMHTGIGMFGVSIVILLLSEVSRSLINYPYHYHEVRGFIGWLSNSLAGLALIYTCYLMNKDRLSRGIVLVGVAISIASSFLPINSGDGRMALDFVLLCLVPAVVFAFLLLKGQVSYLSTLPIFCVACVISNLLSTGLFLDSFQFIASLIFIAGAWLWVYVDCHQQAPNEPSSPGCKVFNVSSASGNKVIAVDECYALKGEGNYTNLLLTNGSKVLHQDGLGTIMQTEPAGFARVHKSYAVNLSAVKQLRSATGSKYWAEMINGEKVPVSRYRVAELRGKLAEIDGSNGEAQR